MATLQQILIGILLTTFFGCQSKSIDKTPLFAKDETNENEKKNNLIVFVGKKLNITALPHRQGEFYLQYKVKYEILQRVYGHYLSDTIEFIASDHSSGTPDFSKYKTVLLFVTKFEGKYYQETYIYNEVYLAQNGRWAGRYFDYDYEHPNNKQINIKPEIINFKEEVSYPLKIKDDELIIPFIKPYYKIVGDKAIVVYGNYVDELFRLRKEGVLTARELFGDKNAKELDTGN